MGHIDITILIDCTEQHCKDVIKQRFKSNSNECKSYLIIKFVLQNLNLNK